MALDPTNHSVKELREVVSGIDNESELKNALEEEESNQDRSTAVRLLKQRINAVQEEEEDAEEDVEGSEEEESENQGPSSRSSQIERL